VTVKVEPPPGTRIAWFTAAASFRTHLHQAARNNKNSIAFALDPDGEFTEIYRADVPLDTEHWHYNASREVRLDEPARAVYVRYVGDPALNNVQVYAHCLDDFRRSDSPVTITHAWTEPAVRRSRPIAGGIGGRLRDDPEADVRRTARVVRLRHVLVAQGRRVGAPRHETARRWVHCDSRAGEKTGPRHHPRCREIYS
jgi:hypothetical protein